MRYLSLLLLVTILFRPVIGETSRDTLIVGKPAPFFFTKSLDGVDFFLSRKVGARALPKDRTPVVLSFFTTTCLPCREEIPCLQKLRDEFPTVSYYLINVNEDPPVVARYIAKMGFTLPVLTDRFGYIAKRYQANNTPTLVIIKSDGNVSYYKQGFKSSDTALIRAALLKVLPAPGTGK